MTSFSIRLAQLSDLKLIHEVAIQTYLEHFTHIWEDAGRKYMDEAYGVKQIETELKHPNTKHYLAFEGKEVVGFIKLNLDQKLDAEPNKSSLELERIYLRKKVIGKGLGKKLIQLAIKIAIEANQELIWLKAMDTNTKSIAFYQKLGFELCGKDQLNWPNVKEDFKGMVVLKKLL